MFKFIENNKEKVFWVLAVILIVVFAISISPKSLQNDTFYTVTIGKLINENGVDGQDHFHGMKVYLMNILIGFMI